MDFLIKNCSGHENAMPLEKILKKIQFSKAYSREMLQQQMMVPLRAQKDFFIGTSNKGIYFINDPEDAFKTICFYSSRIRAEKKHLRNLKRIAKKNKLFNHYEAKFPKGSKRSIYMDESGTPSLKDIPGDPYFIVTGIIFDEKKSRQMLNRKFQFIRQELGKPSNYEFKSTLLNKKQYIRTLKELSTIDYEFAAVCFIKEKLTGQGFNYPKVFYKYAFQFLLEHVLELVGEVDLYFDEYGGKNSRFSKEFFDYVRNQNLVYPINKIGQMDMFRSEQMPFIQLADLIAGTIKKDLKTGSKLIDYVEDKKIEVIYFPFI